MSQQKIIPNLWFDTQAEEAANFYVSVFGQNSGIGNITKYSDEGKEIHGMNAETVMTVDFHIRGYHFVGLNGGPHFTFNPSISFFVCCESSDEVIELWDKLSEDGTPLMPLDSYPFSEKYGWIQDKYGLSWQIILLPEKPEESIIPCMLFVGDKNGKAEEAMNYYTSLFNNSEIVSLARYEANQEGTVMYGDFKLEGQLFAAMDSALDHDYDFNEAVSFMVMCKKQDEIDAYWKQLSADPKAEQCGWLKDKFGVSWQIVPEGLDRMMGDEDPEKVKRIFRAVLDMKKLDINKLRQVYDKEPA